jgi:hypothetical protein
MLTLQLIATMKKAKEIQWSRHRHLSMEKAKFMKTGKFILVVPNRVSSETSFVSKQPKLEP